MVDDTLRNLLEKQHYKVVGNHSAVKICMWLKRSLKNQGVCYKEQFYGIKSHRCLQFTPTVEYCSHQCVYCWRNTEYTNPKPMLEYDEPGFIIDEAVRQHRLLLTGFGGNPDEVDAVKFKEAQNPNQAAISLAGEPTYYPKISELIEELHGRGFTTFLVSNGNNPKVLSNLKELPTNLYLSLDSTTKEQFIKICRPLDPNAWDNLMESLKFMNSLNTTTVTRLTLVKGLNMDDVQGYSDLISIANPDYVEVKAFMFVGGSRERLAQENMPTHQEVRDFSDKLADLLGYLVKDEKEDSRVVLLAKNQG